MTDLRQAAQQALEALERGETKLRWAAITALRAALAEQDSVAAWENKYEMKEWQVHAIRAGWMPAPTPRKPLTDEMVKRMKEVCTSMEMRGAFADGWLSAEAAHGIGEQT